MPHLDQMPNDAIDSVAASARELGVAYEKLAKLVAGAEAARVARVLEFEVAELLSAVAVLRKAFGDQRDEARVAGRVDRGEPARPPAPPTPIMETTQ